MASASAHSGREFAKGSWENLIRLHPKGGGLTIDYLRQHFAGLSPDLFMGLDPANYTELYALTGKLNVSIAINPYLWPAEDFFRFFTQSSSGEEPFRSKALQATEKCAIHGDLDTGLVAHENLRKLLGFPKFSKFEMNGEKYEYHSIGVAAQPGYGVVDHRKDNPIGGSGSHFEIKFKRSGSTLPLKYLCLNFHIRSERDDRFGKAQAIERMCAAIRLFFNELGILPGARPITKLITALRVNLDNFEALGFECRHPKSLEVLARYREKKICRLGPAIPLAEFLPGEGDTSAPRATFVAPASGGVSSKFLAKERLADQRAALAAFWASGGSAAGATTEPPGLLK